MGWEHQLSGIKAEERTANCRTCGPVRISSKGAGRWRCQNIVPTRTHKGDRGARSYRRHKGSVCEACGFTPEHPCQLDVDHIDGDHKNNSPENLNTLCANCHRLKTYKQRWGA